MQQIAAFFLILILLVFQLLSSVASVIPITANSDSCCISQISKANNVKNHHDCCRTSKHHCLDGQCNCNNGHFNNSITPDINTLFVFYNHFELAQYLAVNFISHQATPLHRPPRFKL